MATITTVNCPHQQEDLRRCGGCSDPAAYENFTAFHWCDGQVVSVAEQETTCGCSLTDAEWQALQ